MDFGLLFLSLFTGRDMRPEVKETVQRDVEATYGVDYGLANQTKCTTEGKSGAGIWQWVVATEDNQV